jgi:hypothetical protein
MHRNSYDEGFYKAAADLGLIKEAAPWSRFFASAFGKAPSTVRATGQAAAGAAKPSFMKRTGHFMFGHPLKWVDEIRKGKAFKPDSLLAKNLEDYATPLGMGLGVGLPAYTIGSIAMDDQPGKGSRIAGEALGTLVGGALWRPLGMVGSLAGYSASQKAVNALTGYKPPTTPKPPQSPAFPSYVNSNNNLVRY